MKSMNTLIPKNLSQALQMLNTERNALPLAGSTDLIIKIRHKAANPDTLISIKQLGELDFIRQNDNYIEIGANSTFDELVKSDVIATYAPVLHNAASLMGSPLIRNIATIGGNLGNTSPVADSIPPLFVLDANIKLESVNGARWVTMDEFCLGLGINCRERNELITCVRIPKKQGASIGFFDRLSQRKALSISKVAVAFRTDLDGDIMKNVRIALGAVAVKVKYAHKTMNLLEGKRLTAELIDEAAALITTEATPITDVRSTKEYRKEMLGVLLKRGLLSS